MCKDDKPKNPDQEASALADDEADSDDDDYDDDGADSSVMHLNEM